MYLGTKRAPLLVSLPKVRKIWLSSRFDLMRLYKDLPIEEKIKITPGPGEYDQVGLGDKHLPTFKSQKLMPEIKAKEKVPAFLSNLRVGPGTYI